MASPSRLRTVAVLCLALVGCNRLADTRPDAPGSGGGSATTALVEVSPRVTIDTGFPTQAAGRDTHLFCLCISADGKRVALCSQNDELNGQVWDVAGPKKVDEFRVGGTFFI